MLCTFCVCNGLWGPLQAGNMDNRTQRVYGKHQDVSGQHQTHLGWAERQPGAKKKGAGSTLVLLAVTTMWTYNVKALQHSMMLWKWYNKHMNIINALLETFFNEHTNTHMINALSKKIVKIVTLMVVSMLVLGGAFWRSCSLCS